MNSRIILFYYYEITSLSLICRMKKVKINNIKESLSTQKKGLKPYALRHKHILSLLSLHIHPLLHLFLLYLHKSSLKPSLMSFYHTKYLILTWYLEGPPTTPLGVSKGLCASIHSREDLQPLKISFKDEANTVWKLRS